MNIVVDTDVWVAGVRGSGHANGVLRLCLEGRLIPLMGAALLAEYEDPLGGESIRRKARLTTAEREAFLDRSASGHEFILHGDQILAMRRTITSWS